MAEPIRFTNPAICQEAHANGDGNASVLVDNVADLNIGAYALANAISGQATAVAQQKSGIIQLAYATGAVVTPRRQSRMPDC